jgi:mRNA-degrading endonuclease RelE of RelBE toxin-antitoxin system
MKFEELKEYLKDLKKLSKKYKSLESDIEIIKQILRAKPDSRPNFSFEINGLGIESCIIKIKKIACKSLKGKGKNTGLRLVYAYLEKEKKIIFIEIYHKSNKSSEDRKRILEYFL